MEAGLETDMGPFATTATGDLDGIISTVSSLLRAGFAHGATSIQLRVDVGDTTRRQGLHDALDRIVIDVEREIGVPLAEMDRAQKQSAVARLDAHGAFLLRGSVESIASLMGISRVTLYAYLNAVTGQ